MHSIIKSHKPKYARWLREAYTYAKKSRHPSTHNAALLVSNNKIVLKGINNLPPGIRATREKLTGANKHVYLNHAERDVIYRAARRGIATKGLTMVMPWLPCVPCANAVITTGIATLIVHMQMIDKTDKKWVGELENAVKLLKEAGIKIIVYDGRLGVKAYMHKREWYA